MYSILLSYSGHKKEALHHPHGDGLVDEASIDKNWQETHANFYARDEFLNQINKFISQISATVKQIEGLFLAVR